jgi:pimeloyl-ACP methyl ester carboxylesterase
MIIAEYTIPGMHMRDHLVPVPLNWRKPDDHRTIEILAREVVDPSRKNEHLPCLVFLQGGPGQKSPRPMSGSQVWLVEALKAYRVILLDQRGTGRSSRVEGATMAQFPTGEAAGNYLACFRADSIVADLEHLRKTVFGGSRWETLGQSYGGFVTLTYLSQAPEGLAACYIAGGLPSIRHCADEIYRRTYPRVAARTARLYKRYPCDAAQIGALADFVDANDVRLPDGDRLTVRRLQSLGFHLGMEPGLESVHWLIDEAFSDMRQDCLSNHFLTAVMSATSYDHNPLYAALHESIYALGDGAPNWAAERIRNEHPEFDTSCRPLLFTGEMIYPWMFEEIRSLRPFRKAAEALAMHSDYPQIYDPARLAASEVPVAAAIYHDDMYVDAALSLETAQRIGNLEFWVTNEFEHDGIRQDSGVLARLISMVRRGGGPLSLKCGE